MSEPVVFLEDEITIEDKKVSVGTKIGLSVANTETSYIITSLDFDFEQGELLTIQAMPLEQYQGRYRE